MNRIYKVIWSKVKNCYVVASELAKSRTKSPKSSVISPAIVAGVLACVLSFGAVMPAYAGDATKVSQNNSNNIIGADVWQWLHDNGLINENTTVSYVNGHFVFGNNTTVTNDRNGNGVGVTEADGFIGIGNGISATPRTDREGRYASYMLNGLTALPVISHSIAIGDGVTLREEETIGIGYKALTSGYKAIAIGSGAEATHEKATVVGAGAFAKGNLNTAIGTEAKAYGYRTVAIGYDAQALLADSPTYVAPGNTNLPQRSVAIGSGSRAWANMAVAIGDNAVAEQKKAWVVSIGANSYSGLLGASAIGFGSKAYGKNSVAIGRQAFAGEPKDAVPVTDITNPEGMTSKGDTYGTNALAIGYMAYAPATNSFALGYKAQALGENSFALGSGKQDDKDFDNITKAEGDNSFAIGYLTQVKGIKSGAIGIENKIYGNSVNVFGSNNTVDKGTLETDTVENVLVLGNKNSASIDNKASASRDSGTPTVSGAIGIGNGVILGEENATAIGNGSKSTALNSFAAGQGAEAAAENTTAIGFGATSSKKNALAFGTGASASETDTVAVGSSASASETNAVAIGSFASATKENSVAIGAGSVADVANTVSVGKAKVMSGETVISPEVTRRIMHVTAGTDDTDAVNVKQLRDMALDKANVSLDNITADGHNVIKADAKSAINVKGNMDVKVTKTDVNGVDTYSLSVAKDGTVVGGDTKLVTGDTVYNAIQGVVSDMETALKGKVNVNLDNINADGVNVVRMVAKNAVKVADGENTTVSSETDTDGNIIYKVKTNATGTITANNTGLLNGGTVYNEVRPASDGNYITVANTAGQNLTALDGKLKETYELVKEAATQGHDINVVHYDSLDKDTVTMKGKEGTKITNLKDGEVSKDSTDAVTGKQLHEVKQTTIENKQAIDGLTEKVGTTNDGSYVKSTNTVGQNLNTLDSQLKNNSDAISTLRETTNTQLETKTNTDMSNITETGKETIRELARGSVNVVSEDGTVTVTESNVDTVRTFDLSVVKDGKVESGNTGIVTGGTVYDAIQKSSMITLEDNTIRIGAKNNAEIIDITNSNGEGRVLHGIITDPNDNNSAANVGYVNAIGEAVINNVNGGFRRMDEKINKTGAHAAALASLAPASFDGGEKWALSAAVGNYHGETAAAIGAFYRPADNIMINLRSSLGSGNNMVGAGVSFALDKGFSTGISKKQLVNTINVQAEKLQQAEARIAEQDRRAAEQDKKIAELEAIVKELVKERKP